MFIFTTLFGYLFSVIILILTLPLIFLQSLLKNKYLFDPVIKFICRLIALSFGIRVKRVNWRALDPQKGYVFISNHINLFDPIFLFGFIPQYVRGVELESHFSWPLWGAIIRGLGNIPISHKNPKSALESLEKAGKIIRGGTSICIFPEGHRTRDGKLQAFKSGPFRLARNAEVDMIPVVMKGMWERKTVHSPFVRPGKVEIIFSEAIPFKEVQESSDKELRNRTWQLMQDILSQE